ncbi:hypothetical protein GWI33_019399 [Rhynchophorus ferrugineus]|uniref:C2H2-type domain-containing protein n=2 Tax=Rhynchophorus ferrugineus TaxID=354439 RepID=A0A834HRU5_RHYFE|nr:hypothetical protein GWI33_019399 [Rhynchophorus ferrugineus]
MQNPVTIENGDESEEVFYNVTNLILEDGTKAMLINGTLVTSDGNTLILQDNADINQYAFEENMDHIIIADEDEQNSIQDVDSQCFQINSNLVEYIQDENSCVIEGDGSEVIFVQENSLPFQWNIKDEYDLTEFSNESNIQSMETVDIKEEYIKIEDGIDIEHLLNQEEVIQHEGGSYQYAILKDGKFHLQSGNDVLEPSNTDDSDNPISDNLVKEQYRFEYMPNILSNDINNLSAIKGRNLLTGQSITLAKYMDKIQSSRHKDHIKQNIVERKSKVNIEMDSPLKKLINKKIPIGRTEQGQLLIGKIVNVMKKAPKVSVDNEILLTSPNNKILKTDDKKIEHLNNPISSTNNGTIKNINILTYTRPKKTDIYTKSIGKTNINKEDNSIMKCRSPKVSLNEESRCTADNKVNTSVDKSDTLRDLIEQSNIVVYKKVISKECFDVIARTLSGLMGMDSVVRKLKNRTIILKVLQKIYDHNINEYNKSVSYCSGYMVREYKLNDEQNNLSEAWTFIPDANSKDIILNDGNTNNDSELESQRSVNITIQITVNSDGKRTSRVIIDPPSDLSKFRKNMNNLKSNSSDLSLKGNSTSEFYCTICQLKCFNKKDLTNHIKSHETLRLILPECLENDSEASLQLENHNGSNDKVVKCFSCAERFSDISLLRKHLEQHGFISSVIEKQLVSVSDAAKDKITAYNRPRQNHKIEQRAFGCNICSRQFTRHSNLQRHVEIHKGEGAMYQCTICSCSYHYISSLTRHMIACHMDTSRRPPILKDISRGTINDTHQQQINENESDEVVQVIPLVEIDDNMQFETVDLDTIEHIPDEMEILEIPVQPVID